METYASNKFKRDKSVIDRVIKQTGDIAVCMDDFRVMFPERYINQELATMGSTVRVVCIFAIVDNKDNYCTMEAPIYIDLLPSNISEVEVDGVINKCLYFEKGSMFTGSTVLMKTSDAQYNMFDEFYIKGKVPWFMNYNDLTDLFTESSLYNGNAIGDNPLAYEILASVITRKQNDKGIKYRHSVKDNKCSTPAEYVGLNNIYYSYDNTASKLVGGYYGYGVTAAIVSPEKSTTTVADLLRA